MKFFKTIPPAAWLVLLACCAAAPARAQTPTPSVTKVDPPSWWAGHSINPVRLLVRGRNLHGARVTSPRAELQTGATVVNPAGTYVFVSVHVNPSARPGDYPLTVETPAGRASVPFKINEPLDPGAPRGVTTDDVIYLVMPDRFADGDRSNNAPPGSPREANDRSNPRAWHGGDFAGIVRALPHLKQLGVTALWLTPWYDNFDGVKSCDKPWCPYTYYHGYHAADYYGVENHFGDVEALRALVDKAHALGMKVIQDQVANHVGSQHPWVADPPLDNWFHGRPGAHLLNPFRADLLLSPHAHPEARRPTLDGWFSDDLPDMNQDEPEVARYEIQNALWWVGMTGIDGIRQDTVQYMPRPFIRELSRALDRQHPGFWMVGEVFDRDPAHTAFFLGGRAGWDGIDTELDAVFDFPVWQASLDVFTGRKPARHLRDALKYDALYPDPSRLVTMTNNHDTRRFMSLEGATAQGAAQHHAFILSIRGTPQLYYGEEIGMKGGDDPDNRRDFPGHSSGSPGDAFDLKKRTAEEGIVLERARTWLRLRREHSALRRGATVDLFYDDAAYVFARRDAAETVVVAFNRSDAPKEVAFPVDYLDARGDSRLFRLDVGRGEVPFSPKGGTFRLSLGPRAAQAYRFVR